jgi:hypothetical protein
VCSRKASRREAFDIRRTLADHRRVATPSPGASRRADAPVRRTAFGLERQGLGWTLAIGAIALLFAVGLPLADSAVSTEHATAAGSVTDVGLGVRITPSADWSVIPQQRAGAHRVRFTRSGALVTVNAAPYPGSARAAYERLAQAIDAEDGVQIAAGPETVTTPSGLVGIASAFAASSEQGYFAVFTAHGVLAVVLAESPLPAFHVVDHDMRAMIGSVEIAAARS